MNCRLSAAQFERREMLIELCGDVATQAGIVKDEGVNLSADQRGALEFLIRATRLVRQRFSTPVITIGLPAAHECLARAMES